jgi:Domain of unknown function DUF29
MPAKTTLYDRDFFAWSCEQAGLLRAGKLAEADIETHRRGNREHWQDGSASSSAA